MTRVRTTRRRPLRAAMFHHIIEYHYDIIILLPPLLRLLFSESLWQEAKGKNIIELLLYDMHKYDINVLYYVRRIFYVPSQSFQHVYIST